MLSILHSVKNMAFPYNSGLKTQAWDLGKGKEWSLIPLLSHSCILSSWVFSTSVCRCSGALLPDTCWPPFPLLWLLFKCQVLLWDTFKKILYFNCRIITLQYCDGFCRISTWIGPRYTCVPPHPESLSHLPPHPIASGCHRAAAWGSLFHVSNSHQ